MDKLNFEALSLNDEVQETHPALEIEDIVECVFNFLNLEEIKLCRLVNRTWKVVGAKLLRRRSQITFDFSKNEEFMKTVVKAENFGSLYQRYQPKSSCPFAAFCFYGLLFHPSINNFVRIFEESIRELTIDGELKLLDDPNGDPCELDSLISPNLMKLHIFQGTSTFECHLSLDKIMSIKDLYLENCTVILTEKNFRISPMKINLVNNKYIQNGVNLEKLSVTDFFDLRSTKCVMLEGGNLFLDYAKCVNERVTREVSLTKVELANWNKCNWSISTLFLNEVSFVEENLMTIKEIICTNAAIDISVIQNRPICKRPECIRVFHEAFNPFNTPDITLAHLHEECIVMLPFCFHMDNLREIEISNKDMSLGEREQVEVEVDHLPINVKLLVNNYILRLKIIYS